MAGPDALIDTRGVRRDLGAHIVAATFSDAGAAAFALADGTLHIATPGEDTWRVVALLDGAILDLARDALPGGFICGDDGGAFTRVAPTGAVTTLLRLPGKWVEHVASHGVSRDGMLACSVGRKLHLFTAAGDALKMLDHPSTVTGLAFDARGKRIAASHYNGASLWFTGSTSATPRLLEWKGSHIGIALHPGGDAVVTAMQENALHGWRLADRQHMAMSGYPTKTESLSFSRTGRWLASSGAESVVLWPFFGGGPMGKAPTERATLPDVLCTRVAYHPVHDMCAAGFADGSVVLAEVTTDRVLPIAAPLGSPVTALAWDAAGAHLAFGTEHGIAGLVNLGAGGR